MTKRKRGAQPGNTNALRHGLYTKDLTEEDISLIAELSTVPETDLTAEIVALRFVVHRGLNAVGQMDIDTWSEMVGTAGKRLADVLRAQRVLKGKSAEGLTAAMAVALREIGEEMGIG